MDALQSVQVTSSKDRSGFQLTFAVSRQSPLQTTMLPAGFFDPMITRVIIIVTLNGFPNVLMDGIVTRQEGSPSKEPTQSKLTVTGEDLSVLMDVVEIKAPFPAFPEVAQIYTALAPFMAFGIVPLVIPPIIPVVKTPIGGWDTQTGTHLSFIKGVAQ